MRLEKQTLRIIFTAVTAVTALQGVCASCDAVHPEKIKGFSLVKEMNPDIQSDGGSTLQLWRGRNKSTNQNILSLVIYKSNQVFVARFLTDKGKLMWVKKTTLFATYDYGKDQLDFSKLSIGRSSYTVLPSSSNPGVSTVCSVEEEGTHKRTSKTMSKFVEGSLKREFLKYWSLIKRPVRRDE